MKPLCWDDILASARSAEPPAIELLITLAEDFAQALSQGTMEFYRSGTGQVVMVHKRDVDCADRCCIHNPSNHVMSSFPTHWRGDRGLMERICPHGVGHPDPDHIAHSRRAHGITNAAVEAVHGCDGCCSGASAESWEAGPLD